MSENTREWLKALTSAAVAAFIVVQFVMPTTVSGESMEPSFEDKDYLLINRQAYLGNRTPQRGDVIVFNSHLKDEQGRDKKLIKRVIAAAGDKVLVQDGKVYISGEELKEDYLKDGYTNGDVGPVTVPEGSVFCMGDNRLHSTDSRYLEVGFIDEEEIVGKVIFRLYPFDKFGKIRSSQ